MCESTREMWCMFLNTRPAAAVGDDDRFVWKGKLRKRKKCQHKNEFNLSKQKKKVLYIYTHTQFLIVFALKRICAC